MALSCYSSSNWGELEHLNSELSNVFATADYQPDEAEFLSDILGLNTNNYYSNVSLAAFPDSSYSVVDPFFVASSSPDFFYSDNLSSYANVGCTLCSVYPEIEFEPSFSAKRQKGCYDVGYGCGYNCVNNSSEAAGFLQDPPLPGLLSPEILSPLGPSFAGSSSNPPVFSSGSEMVNVKKGGSGSGGGTLSSQSIAARQRRRKITEKTQELGKLIPGGQKMNTAEMFQAASKYIKFLQAQVGILQCTQASVDEEQENGKSFHCEELNPLLESTLIQEKLYSMEKCLVPEKFVNSIVKDDKIQTNGRVRKDIKELIGATG